MRGEGVAFYVKKWIDCKELPLRISHDQLKACGLKLGTRSIKYILLQLQEVFY